MNRTYQVIATLNSDNDECDMQIEILRRGLTLQEAHDYIVQMASKYRQRGKSLYAYRPKPKIRFNI